MTKIEWTDETWNPTRGCSRVSEGCRLQVNAPLCDVVARDEPSRTAVAVELPHLRSTAAATGDEGIRVSLFSPRRIQNVLGTVGGNRRERFEILRPVIRLVSVNVVNDFASHQRTPELLGGDEPVFIDVSANIGERMTRQLHEDVARGCDRTTAAPVGVSRTRMNNSHAVRVTQANL